MPLSDDQYRAIGRITVAFNSLESSMNFLLWLLINPNINIGRVVLAGENFDRVLDRVKRLSKAEVARENQALDERIQKWAETANDVKQRRNDVMHSEVFLDQPSLRMVGLTTLRRNMREVDLSASKLDRLADEIHNAEEGLKQITRAIPIP
jgi:prefoldin subunit 5